MLRHTITLVFENAVEQPTYCAMYADLCMKLSKELPEFPPPAGGDKPVTFRQILLNTCQDEFEGAETLRMVRAALALPPWHAVFTLILPVCCCLRGERGKW